MSNHALQFMLPVLQEPGVSWTCARKDQVAMQNPAGGRLRQEAARLMHGSTRQQAAAAGRVVKTLTCGLLRRPQHKAGERQRSHNVLVCADASAMGAASNHSRCDWSSTFCSAACGPGLGLLQCFQQCAPVTTCSRQQQCACCFRRIPDTSVAVW